MSDFTLSINADAMTADIAALIGRFRELPRHIARKHMQAAMRRALKPGVPILRRNTPPLGVRRGRKKAGEVRSTGALRKSVTTRAKAVPGRSGAGVVYGVVGYRHGWESRKAIWLESGTRSGIAPRHMAAKSMGEIRGPAAATLVREMAVALEKAAAELAAGKNPTRSYR